MPGLKCSLCPGSDKDSFTQPEYCGVFCDPVLEPLLVKLEVTFKRYGLVFRVVQLSHNFVASSGYFSSIIALASRRPPTDGFPQPFQQPFQVRHALAQFTKLVLHRIELSGVDGFSRTSAL